MRLLSNPSIEDKILVADTIIDARFLINSYIDLKFFKNSSTKNDFYDVECSERKKLKEVSDGVFANFFIPEVNRFNDPIKRS